MTPNFIQAIEGKFVTDYAVLRPSAQVWFENAPVPAHAPVQVFLHVLASEDVLAINIGNKSKSRNVGLIQVDVFVPKDEGSGRAYNYAYDAGRVFKRQVITVHGEGKITLRDPGITSRGDVNGKFSYMMRVPYRYDFTDVQD